MSEKSIAQKLFIKEGQSILLVNEPSDYRQKLGNLPVDVTIATRPMTLYDGIHLFVTSRRELEDQLEKFTSFLKPKGIFWLMYPKGRSKIKADINRDIIASYVRTIGLEGIAMVSIDETWSALRLKIVQ
ncbi:MAG: DUF3052 domain-containing protein [candidate division KSB1 bacterium]|nr:DUF3052 domain-containing protein [candidate division KSB1 bacterium]MDZ7317999.1 DUF3052 domain-containing protein [candidate division KSB1 bacterium]MDZ7341568.1 DUF3052 domain-containing protein [candidate division KSB1 bacterium]